MAGHFGGHVAECRFPTFSVNMRAGCNLASAPHCVAADFNNVIKDIFRNQKKKLPDPWCGVVLYRQRYCGADASVLISLTAD